MIPNDKVEPKVEKAVEVKAYAAPRMAPVGKAVDLIQGRNCCHQYDYDGGGWYIYGQWN